MGTVASYMDTLAQPEKDAVLRVVRAVERQLPGLIEGTSYGMPALLYRGKPLIAVVVRAKFIAIYPYSGQVVAALRDQGDLAGLRSTKGSVSFTPDNPVPPELVHKLVALRQAEIDWASHRAPTPTRSVRSR